MRNQLKLLPDWKFVAFVVPLMALLQVIGPEILRYEQNWLETGQVWRVLTAHWVHVGWMHWFLNCLGLGIMVMLTRPGWSMWRWATTTLTMALGISLLMTLFNTEVGNFAGFSGILYGLFLLGAIRLFTQDRLVAVLVGAAIIGKIGMEQFEFYDFNSGDLIGARVIVDSHLYGVLMAVAIALLWSTYTMNQGTTEQSN